MNDLPFKELSTMQPALSSLPKFVSIRAIRVPLPAPAEFGHELHEFSRIPEEGLNSGFSSPIRVTRF
jgi:hypothetical protein